MRKGKCQAQVGNHGWQHILHLQCDPYKHIKDGTEPRVQSVDLYQELTAHVKRFIRLQSLVVLNHILNVGGQSVAHHTFDGLIQARVRHDKCPFAPRIDTDASENGRARRTKAQKHCVVFGTGKHDRRDE